MRGLLDGLRLLRSVLGFMGRYRAASAVGIAVAVGYIVWHAGTGAYGLPGADARPLGPLGPVPGFVAGGGTGYGNGGDAR